MVYDKIINGLVDNNQPIILVLTFNSNPELFLKKYIEKNLQTAIDLQTYIDLFKLDGDNNFIKKDEVIALQKFCSYSSVENNKKFYCIYNLDKASKESFNSLLKFLEEPYKNIYGVITTSELNILPVTIKSRCRIVYLGSDEEFINNFVNANNKELTNKHWLFSLFNNVNKIQNFFQSEKYYQFKVVFDFFLNFDLNEIKKASDNFKNFSYLEIAQIIKALINIVKDKTSELLDLLEKIRLNLPKSIIFAKLLQILGTHDE